MLCQAVIALPPHRIVLPVRCMDRSFLYIQRGLPQRFGDGGMTMNGTQTKESMQLFAEEVLPAFR